MNAFSNAANVSAARADLKSKGIYLVELAYGERFCSNVIDFIERYDDATDREIKYSGTEKRIWKSESKNDDIRNFAREANQFISAIEGCEITADTVLAVSNKELEPGDVNSTRGRWHIDSFRRMLKIFVFLTDTTERSGPFEYIPGTHKKGFKARMLMRNGFYFDFLNFDWKGGFRPYQRLNDDHLSLLQEKGYRPVPVLCKKGTVMIVDTTAIHRARPCTEGSRFALTAYFR